MDWREAIDGYLDAADAGLRAIRRHLHAHPEPSRQEFETTRYLARQLEAAGISTRLAPSGRGLIADPVTSGPTSAARFAIRGDIDALGLQDAKEVPYRSTRDGVMHACGHDAHATIALGAAMALHACRDRLPRPVAWRAILQPAEEVGEGALEMIEAGALDGVAAIAALHVDAELEVGRIAQRPGPLTAACEDLHVSVRGRGGHGARPHQAVDPIALASQFVVSVYQLIPRSVDSREATVVTFGSIAGGTVANVIPDEVILLGTIRTLSRAASERVKERIAAIGRGLSEAAGARIDIEFHGGIAGVHNDPAVTALCSRAAAEVVGPANVETLPLPSMGGEDFGAYLDRVPGCMMRLGARPAGGPGHHLHTTRFDIDERALVLGARILARGAVLSALES